jgi:hypothetical protein
MRSAGRSETMARASIELLGGHLEGAEVADELDRLYCYEQVVVHWCKGGR